MTNPRPMWIDPAALVALSVCVCAVTFPNGIAIGVAVSGFAGVLNLLAMKFLVDKLTLAMTEDAPMGAISALMGIKLLVVLAVVHTLMQTFHPISVGIGFAACVMGITLRPAFDILSLRDPELES